MQDELKSLAKNKSWKYKNCLNNEKLFVISECMRTKPRLMVL